jgi:hypothetical protein
MLFAAVSAYSYLPRLNKSKIRLNDAKKDASKEEQWRIQQEILSRRKNKSQMVDYFKKVEEKRVNVNKVSKETLWAKTKDGSDPLSEWKVAKSIGK